MSTIPFEFGRLFIRKTIFIFFLLVIAALYFTFLGVADYKNFQENKNDFITAEKSKINFYLTYEQYGAVGFRVILEPSPLSVFFNRYDFTQDIEARIDTSEIIKVYNGRKGEKAFSVDGCFGDLNHSITIFGTLIMSIMGFLSFPNKFHIEYFNKRHYIKTIFARILLLDIFFLLLLAIVYGFARGLGINLLPNENLFFMGYGVSALLLLDIFFLIGLIIKALCNYNRNALSFVMIIWFVFIFAIPEMGKLYRSIKTSQLPSVEKLEMEKLKTLLNSEFINRQYSYDFLSKHHADMKPESPKLKNVMKELYQYYMNNGYKLNQRKEGDLLRKVKQDIEIFSFLDVLFPIDFLNYASSEASGKGYVAYLDFFNYVIEMRDQFMRFYGQKRYETENIEMPLEPFIKNFENIYRFRSRLPGNFGTGVAVMVIYITILASLARWPKRKKKITVEPPVSIGNIRQGHILFLLVNKNKQEERVNALKQGNRSNLHRESHRIMNEEVTVSRFIDYACREKKIEKNKVMENLELFAVQEKDFHRKLGKHSEESKRKLICSLVFAEANEVMIIDNFIKGASAEFEQQFLSLATREAKNDRRIVYIDSEIYTPSSSFIKLDINIKNYRPFQLEPQQVRLR